jgi:hypothetical protein
MEGMEIKAIGRFMQDERLRFMNKGSGNEKMSSFA